MKTRALFSDRDLQLKLSRSAKKGLKSLNAPLYVEMELHFSCMVRKVVHFYQSPPEGKKFSPLSDNLAVSFNSVAAASCSTTAHNSSEESNDSLSTSSSQASVRFIPQWLDIDFSKGEWSGSFGYSS